MNTDKVIEVAHRRSAMPGLVDDVVTLIGLRKEPTQPSWEPQYGDGELAPGSRFVIPFRPGAVEVLPPNHLVACPVVRMYDDILADMVGRRLLPGDR